MAKPCYLKKGSNPPVCGVHNVPLEPHESSEDMDTQRFGEFAFLKCPVSGAVVNDEASQS